ncbi:MAG: hypothetical protein FJ388_13645, partial [Verrucomicrobia bacterium]|nr:hypothetical protein [Verrucomicrobiota bacterium]
MKHIITGSALFVLTVGVACATEVQKFVRDTHGEFAKGEARGVSITEKGELRLAPAVKKVCDLPQPIIWSAARDTKGNLYLAGGEGKVWRVGVDGKPAVCFTAKEQQVQALTLDDKDNLYAASSPDGKVYRVEPDGKSSVFYDPPDKYIWALAFDRQGNLFVACGSKAAIYRVGQGGVAEKYFASDEANIISLGFDKDRRLLAGSQAGGYLYRFDGPGKAFVVFDSPLNELKAIATDAQGNVYALALGEGEKPAPAASAPTVPVMPPPGARPEEKRPGRASELYRVHADGYTETLWTSGDERGFSLAGGPDGAAWVGTGDKGVIYAVRSRDEISSVAKLDGQQVTSLLSAGKGEWIAVTSNLGAVWSIGAGRATEGTWESEALDAKVFSTWGLAHVDGRMTGGAKLAVSSRSGNTDKPEKTWSDWADAERRGDGFALKSPPARYLQVRVKLGGAAMAHAPMVDRLMVYYAPRNLPPQFTKLTVFDPGYGLQKMQQPEPPFQATVDTL